MYNIFEIHFKFLSCSYKFTICPSHSYELTISPSHSYELTICLSHSYKLTICPSHSYELTICPSSSFSICISFACSSSRSPSSLSLTGCGFLAPYLLGSVAALLASHHQASSPLSDELASHPRLSSQPVGSFYSQEGVRQKTSMTDFILSLGSSSPRPSPFDFVAGASAGALLAAIIQAGSPNFHKLWKLFLDVTHHCSLYFLGPFSRHMVMESHIRALLSDLPENVHEIVSGRLFVSITRVKGFQNEIVSHWGSKEELIECLLCSCYIPVFSGGGVPLYKGVGYVDGGFTDNLPRPVIGGQTPKNCLTVSPFCGAADISPDDGKRRPFRVTVANAPFAVSAKNLKRVYDALVPPTQRNLELYLARGFKDTLHYLTRPWILLSHLLYISNCDVNCKRGFHLFTFLIVYYPRRHSLLFCCVAFVICLEFLSEIVKY